jgi:uncharacterized membrane protein
VTFTLFHATTRVALLVLAAMLALGAVWLAKHRHPRSAAAGGALAVAAAGAVGVEALLAAVIQWAAPAASDFNEYRWVLLSPWRHAGLALGSAAVVAIIALAWRSTRGVAPGRRTAMIALRAAAALAALVVYLEPAIELRQVAREPNRIAVLVDDSRSMALRERADGPDRLTRARNVLAASAPALAGWERDHKVDYFTFSDALAATTAEGLARAEPHGDSTQIRKALEAVRARYDGRDLAGVVLISDGAATAGFADDAGDGAARDFLRSLDTRVHTVWAARPGLRDVAVTKVLADEFAFVRTVVRIDAVVRSTGMPGRRATVTLAQDGQPLREKTVQLPADGEVTVTFEVTPPRVGRYAYEISTPVVDGEAVTTNNARPFVIRVIRDKIRVLQVAGQPSWDVRALRQMLESNPNVDLISFFILRTQDDISMVSQDEMSLIPFPTRELFEEELPSFDLIVMQNFEYLPYGIGDYLENIRGYVETGGGLAMLGGPMAFSSGGYHSTPVAAALPVELVPRWDRSEQLLDTARFQPVLTAAGQAHPVTALRHTTTDNLAAWKQLPELEGVNLVVNAKPGAAVLATHPKLRTRTGKPMPVIVAGEYGKGRSLAVTTDTLWRWGFVAAARPGDDGRRYQEFWENAIRWLIQDPDLRNLHVDTDAVEYTPQSTVRIAVRLLGRDYAPSPGSVVKLAVERGADPAKAVVVAETQVTTGDDGTASHELTGLAPGVYRIAGKATVGDRAALASDIFLVRDGGTELDRPTGDESTLQMIAQTTGGSYIGPADVLPADLAFDAPRVVRVDRRADVELWSRPGLLILAVVLLGLEWLLRQRTGRL